MHDDAGHDGGGLEIERVLACIGVSPWIESQIQTVSLLGKTLGAEVYFLHVHQRGRPTENARERLEPIIERYTPESKLLIVGSNRPARVIREAIIQNRIGLVYAGAAIHEPLLKDILGSTARRLARNAECSVLLDPSRDRQDGRFQSVVVSVRLDQSSVNMLNFVLQLAHDGVFKEVHVVHEYQPAPHSVHRSDAETDWRIAQLHTDAELREILSTIDTRGIRMHSTCVIGRDQLAVKAYAQLVEADLVVCRGPRRRIRSFGRLIGNEYESLLTDLPSALMLVHPSQIA